MRFRRGRCLDVRSADAGSEPARRLPHRRVQPAGDRRGLPRDARVSTPSTSASSPRSSPSTRPAPTRSSSATPARSRTTSRPRAAARPTVDPGQTATFDVNVPEAGLTFICTVPGHAAAGMTGTITVKGGTGRRRQPRRPGPGHGHRPARPECPEVRALRRDGADGPRGHDPRHRPGRRGEDDDRGRGLRRRASGPSTARVPGPVIRVTGRRHDPRPPQEPGHQQAARTRSTSTPARSPGTTR